MDLHEAYYMLVFGETEQELLLTLDYFTEFKSYLSKWTTENEFHFVISIEPWTTEWETGGNPM